MVELNPAGIRTVLAPPLVPAQRPIDLVHLSRMTLDDRALEREVLALFDRQMSLMMDRIGTASPSVAAAAAHTLKGSASGVGAWQVANAAAAVENAARDGDNSVWQDRLTHLGEAVRDARCGISELLHAD